MRLRRWIFAILSLVLIVLVVLFASGVPWLSPYSPASRQILAGSEFQVVMGSGLHDDGILQVGAVGSERVALQSMQLPAALDAVDYPVLRYRFENFPRTLELSLVFRREADPEDVQVVSLPWPGTAKAAFDLRDVPGWRGRITEVGFMQSATPQLIPSGIPFAPFRLIDAQLWSPSWRGGLAALLMDWSAYRPWGFFSVSSVDQEAGVSIPRRPALLTVVEASVLIVTVVGVLVFGWRRRQFRVAVGVAVVLGWLLLDAVWVGQLFERQATTRLIYAGKSWPERAKLVPDDDLLHAAQRIQQVVGNLGTAPHVLIHATTPVEMTRLQYLASPVDIGLLVHAIDPMKYHFPAGTVLVLYGMNDWAYDAGARRVRALPIEFPARLLIDEGMLRIFLIETGEQP